MGPNPIGLAHGSKLPAIRGDALLQGDLGLGPVDEKRSHLVPEIPSKHEKAGHKHHIPHETDPKPAWLIPGYPVDHIGPQPPEKKGQRKHDQTDAVARQAHLVQGAVPFEKSEDTALQVGKA